MKESCWQKVIVCWANALQLTEEPILDISDLLDCSFFLKLLKQLDQNYEITSEADKRNIIDKFIEDNYRNIKVKNVLDNKELTLIGSLMLLTSSLEVSHLRVPLYSLSTDIQLNIQAFIQRFLALPKHSVTREIIDNSIAGIDSMVQDEEEIEEPLSFTSSPNSSAITMDQSPNLNSVAKNKVKYLQNRIELLNFDKQHLQDELESTKQDLNNLEMKYVSKEQELLHLKNELFVLKNQINSDEINKIKVSDENENLREYYVLKDDIALLQANLYFTNNELDLSLNENQKLKEKLSKQENEKLILENKLEEIEDALMKMSSTMEEMESKLSILTTTCQEQEALLREKSCVKVVDETFALNDESLMPVTGTGESLAPVIELKYAEILEEVKKLKEIIASKDDEIANLEKLVSKTDKEDLPRENSSIHIVAEFLTSSIELLNKLENETEKLKESSVCDEQDAQIIEYFSQEKSIAEKIEEKYNKLFEKAKKLRGSLIYAKLIDSKSADNKSVNEVQNIISEKNSRPVVEEDKIEKIEDYLKKSNDNTISLQTDDEYEKLKLDLNSLNETLEVKAIQLEESSTLCEKLRRDLTESENNEKLTSVKLKNKTEELESIMSLYQSEINDLRCKLAVCDNEVCNKDDRLSELTTEIADRILEIESLKDQVAEYEQKLNANNVTIKNKDNELNNFKQIIEKNLNEMESLKNELCAKASLVAELKHDVDMCHHEKTILEKKIENLLKDLEKSENLKIELKKSESEILRLNKELEQEKINLKIVQDQVELEEKLNNAFDMKLTELQVKMKQQFEKELNGTVEEYKDKINQLKLKITKDKLHIQELSEDLWNTTDKLLLSQQQCEALRNQLRRTKCALEILSNSSGRRHSVAATIHRASNPSLWLQTEDASTDPIPFLDDPLTSAIRKGIAWDNINDNINPMRRFSLILDSSSNNHEEENEDEIFNDEFMQDLKDGICRLPVSNEVNNLQRASCPPITKYPESPVNVEKVSDKQVLIPPEKPKRKGQISYSKPGPPTPCRTGASRLSLQHFEKPLNPAPRRLKENQNSIGLQTQNVGGTSRLSKLFSTGKGQNKTKPLSQDSPKVKKRNFFQRKFGSNRENYPLPPL
ncbi:hypothetical protein O3M35_013277 [Rhynocoris fuscipes]|uniref:Uncharacterized protein n=1 Tax=Rhynocoris fuscipes TaxID=488301 RepID=A0AAW1CJ26_9HEMI